MGRRDFAAISQRRIAPVTNAAFPLTDARGLERNRWTRRFFGLHPPRVGLRCRRLAYGNRRCADPAAASAGGVSLGGQNFRMGQMNASNDMGTAFLEWQNLTDQYRACIEAVERGEAGAAGRLNDACRRLRACQGEAKHLRFRRTEASKT